MKKLLVFALMVALVSFTVGCRLTGDYDDGVSATTTSTSIATVPLSITLPSATIGNASIRNDFAAADATFFVSYSDTDESQMTLTGLTLTHPGATVSKLTIDGTNYKIKIKIKRKGASDLSFYVKIPTALAAQSGTTSYTVTITISSLSFTGGVATVTYTVTYTAYGSTTSTTTTSTTDTTTPTGLLVTKVEYAGTSTTAAAKEVNGTTPITGVDWTAPIFKVYFNKEVALPTTFTITASATDSNAKTEITFTAGNGQLSTALSTDNKSIVATITGQNSTELNKSLNPGTTYKVRVVATVTATDNTTISIDEVYTFTTAKTMLTKWEAFNAAGTSLGSWTTGATATPTVTVGSISYINLTFDYAMTVPTDMTSATFDKTNGTTAKTALKYTDYFATPAATDSTKKVLKVALKSGVSVATGNYSIKYAAGTFTDANGMAIDTTNTVTFTGQ